MTYLDHAATAPVRSAVVEAMVGVLRDEPGNPTGAHSHGRKARKIIDEARDIVAAAFGLSGSEVIFTGGGTEADNLALNRPAGLVCSAIEHHAVLEPVLARKGAVVGVEPTGVIDLDQLASVLDQDTSIVSVMLANNETGVIQPVHKVARLVRKLAPQALVHVDAVQAGLWLDLARYTQLADLVTVSAHKMGGPMGVGALIVRRPAKVDALLMGGGQEQERRSGTHNVAGIAGFAVAIEKAQSEHEAQSARIASLRDRLVAGLVERVDGLFVTAPKSDKLPNFAHVCVEGVENEALLIILDDMGASASAAASCSSGAVQASHVLRAMGVARTLTRGAVRMTLGYTTTENDIDHALDVFPRAVDQLRGWERLSHVFENREGSLT